MAVSLPDGQVLITGGYSPSSPLLSAELFDPPSETFAELPEAGETELPSPRAGAVAAALPDGQVLIAGGISGFSYLQSAELYYSAPQAAVAGGEFGDQTVGEPSPVAVVVVSNVGAQALSIRHRLARRRRLRRLRDRSGLLLGAQTRLRAELHDHGALHPHHDRRNEGEHRPV